MLSFTAGLHFQVMCCTLALDSNLGYVFSDFSRYNCISHYGGLWKVIILGICYFCAEHLLLWMLESLENSLNMCISCCSCGCDQ